MNAIEAAPSETLSPEKQDEIKNSAIERLYYSLTSTFEANPEYSLTKSVLTHRDPAEYLAHLRPSLLTGAETTNVLEVACNIWEPTELQEMLSDFQESAASATTEYRRSLRSHPDYPHIVVPLGDRMKMVIGVANKGSLTEANYEPTNAYVEMPWKLLDEEKSSPEELDGHKLVNMIVEKWKTEREAT